MNPTHTKTYYDSALQQWFVKNGIRWTRVSNFDPAVFSSQQKSSAAARPPFRGSRFF